MPANFIRMYKQRRRPSRRTLALRIGSFTALDVVRLKTNSLPADKIIRCHGSKVVRTIISSSSNKELVTTEATTNDMRPKLTVYNNAVIIDETDSESDEVDSSQKEIFEEHLTCTQKGFAQATTTQKLQKPQTDCESILDSINSMDIIPDTYELDNKKCALYKGKFLEGKADLLFDDNYKMKASEPKNLQIKSAFRYINTKARSTQNTDDVDVKNEIKLKLQDSKYIPKKTDKNKLLVLRVKMRHSILLQHRVETTAGTRTMNSLEREAFIKYATLKLGTFDEAEDKQIKENWNIFCQDNNWDPKNPQPFLSMKYRNKEFLINDLENRKSFVRCLAHNLPNRCLYSVFHRFKNLFDKPHYKDRYSEEDDKMILRFMNDYYTDYKAADESDRPFADLAGILKRTRSSVWRRYRKLNGVSEN